MPSNLVRCSDDEEYSLLDSLLKKSRSLPENVCVYQNQVGGHGALGNKHGVLYSKELGIVYKPIQHFPKGFHEVDLYERVFNSSRGDEKLSVLRQFMPRYDGLCCDASGKNSYICMEDILADLKRPAICDIKVGRITYTPDATPEKISVEKSKYKWQEEIGFSVTGIKVYDSATGEDVYVDKTHCRTLDPSNIYEHGIRLFLCKDIARARRLASSFVKSLSELCSWFEIQREIAFYSSSLLLAYDSVDDNDPLNSAGELDRSEPVRVHLIDFTRWRNSSGEKDENFLYGLRNVIELFRQASAETKPLSVSPKTVISSAVL